MIRTFLIAVLIVLIQFLNGCSEPEDNNLWNQININDLAPQDEEGLPEENVLQTINFDVLVYEMPVEDFSKLSEVRNMLDTTPFRYNSRTAFSDNAFSVYYGKSSNRNSVVETLIANGAQRSSRTTMMIPEGLSQDITLAILSQMQPVHFITSQNSQQTVQIGPGRLEMRILTSEMPEPSEYCRITVYPFYKMPISNTLTQLNERIQTMDYPFAPAAFGLEMNPGDFILLAPERYINDQSILAGLVFNIPQGSLFLSLNDRQSPQLKPAFRIFLLTCVSVISE